jgi:hypothetical protein
MDIHEPIAFIKAAAAAAAAVAAAEAAVAVSFITAADTALD